MNDVEIYNDDCLSILIGGTIKDREKAIIVTDPPYNMNYHYKTYKDNMPEDEYYTWLGDILSLLPCVVIHYPESLYRLSFQMGIFPERVISWVYNSNTARQHRDICFFNVKPDFTQVLQPYKNPNDKRIKERIANGKLGSKLYDWFNVDQVKNVSKQKTSHPCQIPLTVMNYLVGLLPYDAVIVDPFMGSGTTGEAVVNMNRVQGAKRKFVGVELDETYFNISKERLHKAQQQLSLF